MSNSNLTSYNFHNSDIRVEQNDKGEVLFCLKDVCSTLQLSNINHVINQLKEEFEGGYLKRNPFKNKRRYTECNLHHRATVILRNDEITCQGCP